MREFAADARASRTGEGDELADVDDDGGHSCVSWLMLRNEVKLSNNADAESINGKFIWETEYGRPIWIVMHHHFRVDQLS